MKRIRIRTYLVVAVMSGIVLLAACAGAGASAAVPAAEVGIDSGQELYGQYCAACHGQNAEGSDLYPALPGHSEKVVLRQVRNPIGQMPSFSLSQISDEELGHIARFIVGLPVIEKPIEPLELNEVLVMHHWMAILALGAEDTRDALNHIDHILAMELEHEHEEEMKTLRQELIEGHLHDVLHGVQEMLAGEADPELAMEKLHLTLALSSAGAGDMAEAEHHLGHYLEMATGTNKVKAEEVLDLIAAQDFHDVGHEIEELMGGHTHAD